MKTLVKWFVKMYVSKDAVKELVRTANKALREKAKADEGKQKVIDVGNDVAEVTGTYLSAYADDGAMDDEEETKVNSVCEKMLDKYLKDGLLESCIDKLFS